MKTKKTTEDYLKTIYIISQTEKVHACRVAEMLGVSRPTVSTALKRFEQEGYLDIDSSNVIRLTDKGLHTALDTYQRHMILQNFLISLGVEPDIAHRDACEMEHGLGSESYNAIRQLVEESDLLKTL